MPLKTAKPANLSYFFSFARCCNLRKRQIRNKRQRQKTALKRTLNSANMADFKRFHCEPADAKAVPT
jgi:hypothetical protein